MNKGSAFGYSLGWTKNKVHILKTIAFPNSSKAAIRHCNLEDNVVSLSLIGLPCFGTMNKGRAFGYSLGWTKNKAFPNSSNGFHSRAAVRHPNLEHNVVSPSLLGRVVTIRNYSAATSLYKKYVPKGILASCTLNILMNSFCLEGKVDSGFSLLGTFFKRGIVPDVTTFNTLLRGLFRKNRTSDAMELGWKIINDKLCQPNAVMCWIVSNGLYFTDDDGMIDWLFDLTNDNPTFKYDMKIHSLLFKNKIDEIPGIIGDMNKDGIAPDVNTYNILIEGFGNLGNWNEVKRLWIEMLSFDIQPSLITYMILIESLTKHGLMKDPMHVFETMVHRGETVIPACKISYDRLIDICCVEGQKNEVRSIFDTVVANGFVPGISTFNFILEGLLQSGSCDMARDLFTELQLGALKPNFDTYCVMLDGLCKNGLDNEAFQLLEKVEKEGVELPMTMYSMILDELRKTESFSSVSVERMEVLTYTLSTDTGTYRKIIKGLCEHGLLEEAKVLFANRECVGYTSNYLEANTFVQGLLKGGKYDDVVAYLDKMVGREFGLNSSNMSQVLEFISKKEDGLVPSQKMVRSQNVKAAKATSTSSKSSFEEAYEDELMVA